MSSKLTCGYSLRGATRIIALTDIVSIIRMFHAQFTSPQKKVEKKRGFRPQNFKVFVEAFCLDFIFFS